MPSKTKKQARFFAACSHGAKYKKCPPKKVSKEFNKADKRTGILKEISFDLEHDPFNNPHTTTAEEQDNDTRTAVSLVGLCHTISDNIRDVITKLGEEYPISSEGFPTIEYVDQVNDWTDDEIKNRYHPTPDYNLIKMSAIEQINKLLRPRKLPTFADTIVYHANNGVMFLDDPQVRPYMEKVVKLRAKLARNLNLLYELLLKPYRQNRTTESIDDPFGEEPTSSEEILKSIVLLMAAALKAANQYSSILASDVRNEPIHGGESNPRRRIKTRDWEVMSSGQEDYIALPELEPFPPWWRSIQARLAELKWFPDNYTIQTISDSVGKAGILNIPEFQKFIPPLTKLANKYNSYIKQAKNKWRQYLKLRDSEYSQLNPKMNESLNDYMQTETPLNVWANPGHPETKKELRAGSTVVVEPIRSQTFILIKVYKGNLRGKWYADIKEFRQATKHHTPIERSFQTAAKPEQAVLGREPTALARHLGLESVQRPSFTQFLTEGEYKIHPHYDIPAAQKKLILELYRQSDYTREKFIEAMKSRGMDVMKLIQKPAFATLLGALKFR